MRIQQLFLVLIVALIMLMVGTLIIMSQFTILRSYESIEHQQLHDDIQRVNDVLDTQLASLNDVARAWAYWDDAYHFVLHNNRDFIDAELTQDGLSAASIHSIMYLSAAGDVLVNRSIASVSGVPLTLSDTLVPAPVFTDIAQYKSGMVFYEGHLVLVSVFPVLTSHANGPVGGTLVIARILTDDKLEQLRQTSRYTFSLHQLTDLPLTESQKTQLINGNPFEVHQGDLTIIGYAGKQDFSGNLSLGIRLERPRTIYTQGLHTLRTYTISLIGAGVIATLIFTLITRLFIVKPIVRIRQELKEITHTKDFSRRLHPSWIFDLKRLTINMNDLLEANQQLTQVSNDNFRRLQQQLYQIESKNVELEKTKLAMMNILEDERNLEEQLKDEKISVERKVYERTRELREEQAKLKGSINNLPVGFMLIDKLGKPVIVNQAMTAILKNHTSQQIINLIQVWIANNQQDVTLDEVTKLPTSAVDYSSLTYKSQYVTLSVVPINLSEKTGNQVRIGWVVLLNDITEEKVMERSRDEFFSIASHELRTPLTAIRGNAAMISGIYQQTLDASPDLREMVDDIHQASTRLIRIVNDFLNTSRLEQNRMEFSKEVLNMPELVAETLKEFEVTGSEKKVVLELTPPAEALPPVYADKDRVRQILTNFIGNALKFTANGKITVTLSRERQHLKVQVTDTGIGIAKTMQPMLFRKFQQAKENIYTRDTTQGTGLGLYISKLMAEGMGGQAWLEQSEEGKGSTFAFTLPLANESQPDTIAVEK